MEAMTVSQRLVQFAGSDRISFLYHLRQMRVFLPTFQATVAAHLQPLLRAANSDRAKPSGSKSRILGIITPTRGSVPNQMDFRERLRWSRSIKLSELHTDPSSVYHSLYCYNSVVFVQ
jgi:hypothetical protein